MKIPEIEISENEKLWLEAFYELQKEGKETTNRTIKAKLHEKIPYNFNSIMLYHKGLIYHNSLSLLGQWIVTSDESIFEETDRAITAIKDMLLINPERHDIKADELAAFLKTDKKEAISLLSKVQLLSPYNNGSTSSGEGVISIRITDEEVFNRYLGYQGIEKAINEEYKRTLSKNETKLIPSSGQSDIELEKSNIYFKSNIHQIDYKLCFVLMPFSEDWSDSLYKGLIRNTIEDQGLQCLRADNLYGQIIIEDIWTKINQSALIVADVTGRNPNVMYELGLVHALGIPSILITQNLKDIPFDFRHLRHYEYQNNKQGLKKLKEELPVIVREVYKEYYSKKEDVLSGW